MLKKFFLVILILFSGLIITACHRPNTILLFNDRPITKETLLDNKTNFLVGKRIYYIFITEKKLETKFLRVRVLKKDENADGQAIPLVYSFDFRLNKDQVFYYTNYIVIHTPGEYEMVIYNKDNPVIPLTCADFRVK